MGEERGRAEEYARKLKARYGDDLIAVVLYGSAARDDFRKGVSDLNLLVIVRATDPATLRRGSALAREWIQQGNPPPLLLGAKEWRDSADVFPIEYSDMRDAHVVLEGADPFDGIEIEWIDLRLQCEHEIKTKQIQLRERYLVLADDPKEIGSLLTESLPTFLTLFRTCLRLVGRDVPRENEAVIGAIADLAGFERGPLDEIAHARRDGTPFEPAGDSPVVTGYLDAVGTTTAWLDGLSASAPPPG